jgi:hypothetical protein
MKWVTEERLRANALAASRACSLVICSGRRAAAGDVIPVKELASAGKLHLKTACLRPDLVFDDTNDNCDHDSDDQIASVISAGAPSSRPPLDLIVTGYALVSLDAPSTVIDRMLAFHLASGACAPIMHSWNVISGVHVAIGYDLFDAGALRWLWTDDTAQQQQ